MKKASKLLLALMPALSLSVFSAGVYANSSSGLSYNGITPSILENNKYSSVGEFWTALGLEAYKDGKVVTRDGKPATANIQNTAGKYLKYSLLDYGESGLTNTELRAPRSNEIVSYYDYANETAYFVNTKTNQILFSADGEGVVTTVGADGKTYSRHVPEISEYIYEIKMKSVNPLDSTIDTGLSAADVTDIHARLSSLGTGKTQVGGGATAGGENATAVGYNATANHTNSVAVGANSQTTRPDEVNVGNRVIGGLRDGVQAADAATYGQLERYRIAEENARIQGDAQTLKSANTYTDNRVSTLERSTNQQFRQLRDEVEKNRKRADAGIAGAMAMTAIPVVEGKTYSFGMAASNYRDEQAIAAGMHFRTTENSAVRLNASWDTQNGSGVAAGMSVGW
ncbi:YadA-like family protein [Escherichia coli]|nr:hemagglutinin [Escherichia coli]EFN0235011.1 hemagglutinin [Escherichia coli]EHI0438982.1 hemagglutinin [Escherichia coli]EIG9829867.1 YadA-like family protein [Escherichia coli]EIG9845437.1 YadA-like family protein [Escherichia coli]